MMFRAPEPTRATQTSAGALQWRSLETWDGISPHSTGRPAQLVAGQQFWNGYFGATLSGARSVQYQCDCGTLDSTSHLGECRGTLSARAAGPPFRRPAPSYSSPRRYGPVFPAQPAVCARNAPLCIQTQLSLPNTISPPFETGSHESLSGAIERCTSGRRFTSVEFAK